MSRSQPWIACTLECGAVCLFLFFFKFLPDRVPKTNGFGAMTASAWQAASGRRLIKDLMDNEAFTGVQNLHQKARAAMRV
jgi:hypothetical protein